MKKENDLQNIVDLMREQYSDCIERMTDISDGMILSDREAYKFDQIVEKIYGKEHKPKSADGLFFQKGKVLVVEFKGGMRNKHSSEDEGYKDQRDNIKKRQRTEIYAKGLDSYLILEHDFKIECGMKNNRVVFLAVIDDPEVDAMDETISILNEASGKHERNDPDNEVDELCKALMHLNYRGESKNPYMYSYIDVMSARTFCKRYGQDNSKIYV